MKKILFLLLICFIKLNGYEYLIYNYPNANIMRFFSDNENNSLKICVTRSNGEILRYVEFETEDTYLFLDRIKHSYKSLGVTYTNKETFDNWLKTDLQFLNDFYVQHTNYILNYLYNDNSFSNSNYINYENYQILYNDDGLAVESIVGGVWKGLYDTPENSGLLYDRQNNILYDNGQVASLFQRFWFSLTGNVSKTLKLYYISMLGLNVFILIVAVYLVKVLLGLIIKWISTIINNTKVNVNLGAQKRW